MPTVLITGATRGLGLAAARAAAARHGAHVLVAGRHRERTAAMAHQVGGEPVVLDLGSLASVRAAAAGLPHVDGVACNAGLQITGPPRRTEDGFEETFQVNHLAHVALVDALLAHVALVDALLAHVALVDALLARAHPPARVAFVGSATHDPAQRTGLPTPPDADVEELARGDFGDGGSAGRRRYSTSKLLTTAVAAAYARDRPDVAFGCLDPGLMPSTGLAREYPRAVARAFAALERPLSLLPFASTPERSGLTLAGLVLDDVAPSGATIDHRGRPARISERAADPAFQDEVLAVSRRLLRERGIHVAAGQDDPGPPAGDPPLQ